TAGVRSPGVQAKGTCSFLSKGGAPIGRAKSSLAKNCSMPMSNGLGAGELSNVATVIRTILFPLCIPSESVSKTRKRDQELRLSSAPIPHMGNYVKESEKHRFGTWWPQD